MAKVSGPGLSQIPDFLTRLGASQISSHHSCPSKFIPISVFIPSSHFFPPLGVSLSSQFSIPALLLQFWGETPGNAPFWGLEFLEPSPRPGGNIPDPSQNIPKIFGIPKSQIPKNPLRISGNQRPLTFLKISFFPSRVWGSSCRNEEFLGIFFFPP